MFNRLRVVLDRHLTAANALDRAVNDHPEARLLHFDHPTGYTSLSSSPSVREIHAFVARVSRCLLQAGMQRFDRVLIYKTNSPDYFLLALAIIRAGGIAVPVNPGLPRDKLQQYVAYTGARIAIGDAAHFMVQIGEPRHLAAIRTWIFPDVPDGFDGDAIAVNAAAGDGVARQAGPVELAPDDPVMIVHTSGTTGFPKGVISTSRGIVQGIKRHYVGEPIPTSTRIALAGHFNHLVCHLGLFASLVGNLPVWALTNFAPQALLEGIQSIRPHVFFAFPDLYLRMYLHGLDDYDLSSIQIWIATADASHEIHMEAFSRKGTGLRIFGRRLVGAVFIEPLGSSEVGFAVLQRYYVPLPWIWKKTHRRADRCVGWRNIAGPRVRVADESGRSVPANQPGRLMVKGPTLFAGYWNSHETLLGVVKDGWWWTGDIVRRDRLGCYYHLDRDTDVIRTSAGEVYSLPMEECLLRHPDVGEVAVVGLNSGTEGQVPVAIVHARPNASLDADDVLRWARARMTTAKPLAAVIVVEPDEMPRGLTGKVLKRELRERFASYLSACPV